MLLSLSAPGQSWTLETLRSGIIGAWTRTADFDQYGDPDITYAGTGGAPQALGWSENQSNGANWVVHDITPPTLLQMIPTGIADIDGDGDQDIVFLIFDYETAYGAAVWPANPGITTSLQDRRKAVDASVQLQLNPNPFSTTLHISYQLPEAGMVRLCVYDLLGRPVFILAEGRQTAGAHTFSWLGQRNNGLQAPAGLYIVRLGLEQGTVSKTIVRWSP